MSKTGVKLWGVKDFSIWGLRDVLVLRSSRADVLGSDRREGSSETEPSDFVFREGRFLKEGIGGQTKVRHLQVSLQHMYSTYMCCTDTFNKT